jgi:hypothetical protein
MQKHVRIYLDFFDYGETDFIPSEISPNNRASDIHHIRCRGMGGSKDKDVIENLMALTREEHDKYGDKKQYIEYLQTIHNNFIKQHNEQTS